MIMRAFESLPASDLTIKLVIDAKDIWGWLLVSDLVSPDK